MAGNKYLHLVAGALTEIRANDVSAGVGDAGKLVALNGSGKIDLTMLPTGVGPDIKNMASGEDLAAGDFVYVDASGEANKADASDPTKFADGFVLAGVTAPAVVDVYFEGINDGVSGFTVGALVFLSDSPAGEAVEAAPTAGGSIVQRLGKAIAATEIACEIAQPITLVA